MEKLIIFKKSIIFYRQVLHILKISTIFVSVKGTNKTQIRIMRTTSNIIATTNSDIERAAFMVAKSNGIINPVILGAKVAMISELKKRLAKGEVVEFEYIKKSTGELRHATGMLPQRSSFIAARINGRGVNNAVYGNCTYFDLDRNAFRCFSYETLVRVF